MFGEWRLRAFVPPVSSVLPLTCNNQRSCSRSVFNHQRASRRLHLVLAPWLRSEILTISIRDPNRFPHWNTRAFVTPSSNLLLHLNYRAAWLVPWSLAGRMSDIPGHWGVPRGRQMPSCRHCAWRIEHECINSTRPREMSGFRKINAAHRQGRMSFFL